MFVHFSQLFFAVSFTHFVLKWSFHVQLLCYGSCCGAAELQYVVKAKSKAAELHHAIGVICDNLTIVEVISVSVMKFLWLSDS